MGNFLLDISGLDWKPEYKAGTPHFSGENFKIEIHLLIFNHHTVGEGIAHSAPRLLLPIFSKLI